MVEADTVTLEPSDRAFEADRPRSPLVRFGADKPLRLDAGVNLAPFQIAYQTYGTLNADRSNAVLICHALTGDQHVANVHPVTGKSGWWETMVGPGRPIDTERYFVICPNVVGACMGTTGPASTNPATGQPWGLDFPVITIRDMVRAQAMLIDHLGIETLFAVAGGSMGGMQVLQWTASYPERVFAALPIACSTRHSAQNIAFHEVGRQAVMADPEWRGGRYFAEGTNPRRGLAVARMGAHITYLSDAALHRKFGRKFQDRDNPTFSFDADFQVESYLRHQGISFVERFDANSYLYLTRAMDYFDLAEDCGGVLANAWKRYADAVLRDLVHLGLAVSDLGVARHRACAQRRRRARVVRRDRHRQGPRRVPARGARAVRDRARLPRRRRQGPRPADGRSVAMLKRLKRDLTMAEAVRMPGGARVDLIAVAEMVAPGAKVLDVGCGDGELLRLLETRGVDGRGIELSREGVNECVAKGLAVIQGDADTDLSDYPDDAFDYVILSQTLQATRHPRVVLEHMLRIGRHAIVSFPNFGHWKIRLQLLFGGHMPQTDNLPYAGGIRRTSTSAPSRTSASCAKSPA